jgi:hypothetical protein
MESPQKPIDLALWLNADLIQRQNQVKTQFISVLMDVGNFFPADEFSKISSENRGIKLSKGNDLVGFPYHALDLIRDFDSKIGANIRILNWFGNGLYITVLLGKERKNPIKEFLECGFHYGLSENLWDYPDLIWNKNFTSEENEINGTELGFYHWIQEFKVDSQLCNLKEKLIIEIKKILDILTLSNEQSRN